MKELKEPIVIRQYQAPSKLYEYGAYAGAIGLFAATVVNPGVLLWPGALTGILLYWNYLMFDIVKKYVKYVNANELSNLLETLALDHANEQKDGTLEDTSGLITREDEVNEEEEQG